MAGYYVLENLRKLNGYTLKVQYVLANEEGKYRTVQNESKNGILEDRNGFVVEGKEN